MVARIWFLLVVGAVLVATSVRADEKGGAAKKAEPADAILGKWWFPERNGKMEVLRDEDGQFYGKVIAYDDPDAVDEHNPDPKLRTRRFIGITMLADFQYNAGKEQWDEGTIYDGDSGKTYSCKLWFEDDKPGELKARGFVGFSLLGRTETFYRVTKEEEEADATKAAEAEKSNAAANK